MDKLEDGSITRNVGRTWRFHPCEIICSLILITLSVTEMRPPGASVRVTSMKEKTLVDTPFQELRETSPVDSLSLPGEVRLRKPTFRRLPSLGSCPVFEELSKPLSETTIIRVTDQTPVLGNLMGD